MRALVLLQLLPLLVSPGIAAPRTDSRSEQPDSERIQNLFIPGPDHLSILQAYLKEKDPLEENASNMKRETTILHLFALHDFDKSGFLDGLELMRLLHGVQTIRLQEEPAHDSVISLVDEVLEKQDLNKDGLLSAQEIVTPPVYTEDAPPVHVAIPAPQTGDLQGSSDNDTNTNEEKIETDNPPAEDDNAHIQINDSAPPPEDAIQSQEDGGNEKINVIEVVLDEEEEEEEKHEAGNEM
ncbi:cell growth regulator with EF hand domain protein 1 [Pseudophryne corroboree]|uniref:cell growth regulator with EF hand domain protein 1 n=1 Tax=Pseudophryne corroboree TaxID=495146 RepID=UPI0030814FAE